MTLFYVCFCLFFEVGGVDYHFFGILSSIIKRVELYFFCEANVLLDMKT